MPCSGRTQRRLSVDGRGRRPSASTWARGRRGRSRGIASASTSAVARPGLSITANSTPSRSTSCSRVRPVLRRKPSSACGGAPARGPFSSSRHGRGLGGQVARDQREAARRGEGVDRAGARARPWRARRRTAARDRRAPCPASARGFPRSGVRGGSRSCALHRQGSVGLATRPFMCVHPRLRTRPSRGRGRGRYRPGARRPRSRRAPAAG